MPLSSVLSCTRCGTELQPSPPGVQTLTFCPGCGVEWGLMSFPALHHAPVSGQTAERVLEEGESACFYHPEKRASVPCDQCGRFLCALCDIELEDRHLCPSCLASGRDKRKLKIVEQKRTRYDAIVWSLLILPLPFCAISAPVTASAALVLALKHWAAPPSLVARTKLRLILGLLVGCAELGFSIWFWNRTVFSSWHVAK